MSLFVSGSDVHEPAVAPIDTISRLMSSSTANANASDTQRARTPARWMSNEKRAPSPPPEVFERLEAEYDEAYEDPFFAGPPPAAHAPAHQSMMPRVKQPLRVEPPPEYNCPARVDLKASAEGDGGLTSMHAIAELTAKVAKKAPRRGLVSGPGAQQPPAERMKDFAMLAQSARRAGYGGVAGVQAFKQGVLFDNVGDYAQAIKCYKHFLESCLESGDTMGEALACNSIGVDYQLMGADSVRGAVQYHTKHLSVADVPGKYIAHVNLGLCYASLGMAEEAVQNHQHALRYAIRMCSLAGESLACGNLGQAASVEDIPTAKACAERQLQLARTLNDNRGKGDAFRQLGMLSNLQGEYDEAQHYFEQAMQLASMEGVEQASNSARCAIGVARGNAQFDSFLLDVVEKSEQMAAEEAAAAAAAATAAAAASSAARAAAGDGAPSGGGGQRSGVGVAGASASSS